MQNGLHWFSFVKMDLIATSFAKLVQTDLD